MKTPQHVCPNRDCSLGFFYPILEMSPYEWASYRCPLCKKYFNEDLEEVDSPLLAEKNK